MIEPSFWNYIGSAVLLVLYLTGVGAATKRMLRPVNALDWALGGGLVGIVAGFVAFLLFLGWYWLAVALGSVTA